MKQYAQLNEKRAKLLARLNEITADYELSLERVRKALAAEAAAALAAEEQETELRAEMERKLQTQLAEIRQGVNAAKSETGTAQKMLTKFKKKYAQTHASLMKCLPSIDSMDPDRFTSYQPNAPIHKTVEDLRWHG